MPVRLCKVCGKKACISKEQKKKLMEKVYLPYSSGHDIKWTYKGLIICSYGWSEPPNDKSLIKKRYMFLLFNEYINQSRYHLINISPSVATAEYGSLRCVKNEKGKSPIFGYIQYNNELNKILWKVVDEKKIPNTIKEILINKEKRDVAVSALLSLIKG